MLLTELHEKYEAIQKNLDACEAQADDLRKQKGEVAEEILKSFGSGPHELGGRKLIVTRGRGGGAFLREPPTKKSKSS